MAIVFDRLASSIARSIPKVPADGFAATLDDTTGGEAATAVPLRLRSNVWVVPPAPEFSSEALSLEAWSFCGASTAAAVACPAS